AARGLAGRPRAHRLALEHDYVARAAPGQVVGDAGADRPRADDHDVGRPRNHDFLHGGPRNGPPIPPNARRRPGEAVAPLDYRQPRQMVQSCQPTSPEKETPMREAVITAR